MKERSEGKEVNWAEEKFQDGKKVIWTLGGKKEKHENEYIQTTLMKYEWEVREDEVLGGRKKREEGTED